MLITNNILILIFAVLASVNSEKSEQSVKDKILESAPWRVKMMILKNMQPEPISKKRGVSRRVAIELLKQSSIETSNMNSRRSGGNLFSITGDDIADKDEKATDDESDEKSLKIKIFRLMYETIRDSDVKVRRAELIREYYIKVPSFNIGFLIGEVQDKYDIMMEFRSTLRKFYDAWKPVEHINAYEQIANYAVELNDLVGLIQTLDKNRTRASF